MTHSCILDVRALDTACGLLDTLGTCSLICQRDATGACVPVSFMASTFVEPLCKWQESLQQCSFPCYLTEASPPPLTTPDPPRPPPPPSPSPPPPATPSMPPPPPDPPHPPHSPPPSRCKEHQAPEALRPAYARLCWEQTACEDCVKELQFCQWDETVVNPADCS